MNKFQEKFENQPSRQKVYNLDSKSNKVYSVNKSPVEEINQENHQDESPNDKFLYFWHAKEYEKKPKSTKALTIIYLITFSLVVYSFFINNLLMSVLFILIGVTYYFFEKREPKECTFGITYEGIFAEDQLYEFNELKSFWIFYQPGGLKELSLESQKFFMPFVEIPIASADPVKIHRIIRTYLPEKEHRKPVTHLLSKYLD